MLEETKRKIGIALKEAYKYGRKISHMKGKHHSEETKLKMSKAHNEKTRDGLCRIKQSIKVRKQFKDGLRKSPTLNKHHPEETKRKIGESNKIRMIEYWKNNKPTEKQLVFQKNKINNRCNDCGTILSINKRHNCKEIINKLKENRKKQILPVKDTSIEVKIQNFLKQLNIEFYTHQYLNEIKNSYQCDILIPSIKLVIECFGNYWHKYPYGREIDNIRCKELREKGFKVLVFWENEIKTMQLEDLKDKLEVMN